MGLTRPTANQISSTTMNIDDPLIEINKSLTGANADDIGFILNRGSSGNNVAIIWDRSASQFALIETTATGSSTGDIGVANYADLRVGTITASSGIPAGSGGIFSDSYTSSDQTITSAGPLTLAHGLGSQPELIQLYLKCTTAEHGYSVNDELLTNPMISLANGGVSIVSDATNINVRYGAATSVFVAQHKTTGTNIALTNGSWDLIVKAWI